MRKYKWDPDSLLDTIKSSYSFREVMLKLGLIPAGGNYRHIQRIVKERNYSTEHFFGQGANRGIQHKGGVKIKPLAEVLTTNSLIQSFKLKKRLFNSKLKDPQCEECGWAKRSEDGRIPLELDHINGIHSDNRLENLRILCPNCHSLKPTHRGRNKKKA